MNIARKRRDAPCAGRIRLRTRTLKVPSAPRFFARNTSAIPPAPRRRTTSNWAISEGGGGVTEGVDIASRRGATSLHSIARHAVMADSNANRPAPTANGTLAKTPFLHLILYALEKKLTGTMEFLTPDKRTAVLLFVGGQPAKVR